MKKKFWNRFLKWLARRDLDFMIFARKRSGPKPKQYWDVRIGGDAQVIFPHKSSLRRAVKGAWREWIRLYGDDEDLSEYKGPE